MTTTGFQADQRTCQWSGGGGGGGLVGVPGYEWPLRCHAGHPGGPKAHLPVGVAGGAREAHERASVVEPQRGSEVDGRDEHGGLHVVHVHRERAEPRAPVAHAAVDPVGVGEEPRAVRVCLECLGRGRGYVEAVWGIGKWRGVCVRGGQGRERRERRERGEM